MSVPALIVIAIKASIVLTMVGIGLSATVADALSVLRSPKKLARSLGAMVVVVPLFAAIVAATFDLEPDVKIALAALSVSPVPPFWPSRAKRGGGDESYTVGLLVASALLSIIIIPIVFELFGMIFSIPINVPITRIVRLTLVTILVPLFAGIVIRAAAARFAYRAARPIGLAGTILLVGSVIPILFKSWDALTSLVNDGTMLTMAAFTIVGLLAGQILGGPSDEERTVLSLASTTRHPGIALALAQASFPSSKLVAAAILLYVLVSSAVSAPYLRWTRRQIRNHEKRFALLR